MISELSARYKTRKLLVFLRGFDLTKICVTFGFVQEEMQAKDADIVRDLSMEVKKTLPQMRVFCLVKDSLHEGDQDEGELFCSSLLERLGHDDDTPTIVRYKNGDSLRHPSNPTSRTS
jgi:hypothetical protein